MLIYGIPEFEVNMYLSMNASPVFFETYSMNVILCSVSTYHKNTIRKRAHLRRLILLRDDSNEFAS